MIAVHCREEKIMLLVFVVQTAPCAKYCHRRIQGPSTGTEDGTDNVAVNCWALKLFVV